MPDLITQAEAAEILGLSRPSVRRLALAGALGPYQGMQRHPLTGNPNPRAGALLERSAVEAARTRLRPETGSAPDTESRADASDPMDGSAEARQGERSTAEYVDGTQGSGS